MRQRAEEAERRREMEMMEHERQRTQEMEEMMLREQERQARDEEEDQKKRERQEKNDQMRREREEAKRKGKEEIKDDGAGGGAKSNRSGQGDLNFKGGDPLDHNEGDIDLEPHLKPLMGQAGGNVEKLGLEALRRALTDGTLLVVGVKLWSALHSDTWRHREAASQAFLDFCSKPLLPKY